MPPQVKITESAILDAALGITRTRGITGVNARELAAELGCSIQPVFRCFQNMDNLKQALYAKAEALFDDCMRQGLGRHEIPFLGMGLAYIEFAKTEKSLFKFLFMSDEFKGRSVLGMIRDDENKETVRMIAGMTGLDFKMAQRLFLSIWLTTHGIASLMATNDCDFSERQIASLLMDSFSGMKNQLRSTGSKK